MDLLQFSLLDMTPYDKQSWFSLVAGYREGLEPFRVFVVSYIVIISLLLFKYRQLHLSQSTSVRLVLGLLGSSWIWCGVVFHWQHFANLNWAAPLFGWVFIVQGVLLLLAAFTLKQVSWISFITQRGALVGVSLAVGLLAYPFIGIFEGRVVHELEWFPLLPAPVTLVTFAILMLMDSRWRHGLVVIPLLWAIVSGAFAYTLGLLEFYFMAGVILFWISHFFAKKTL